MVKKGLAVAVILLFIGMCVVPSSAVKEFKEISPVSLDGNILYVGGSGPNNYTTIQGGIDASSHGDTVFVYSGTYIEYQPNYYACVVIDKKINLIGEDKYTTIIDGGHNRYVVRIYADDIIVSGFTIQNSGNHDAGIVGSLTTSVKNYRIYGNIIKNNGHGFLQGGTEYCEVYDNIITDNDNGIYVGGNEVSIYGNIIEGNGKGIIATSGNSVTIQDNHFENNAIGIKTTACLITISENNFIDNGKHADFQYNLIPIFLLFMSFLYRNNWKNNYWDDWKLPIPRPILGSKVFIFAPMLERFGPFPSFQFDRRPVITPYDIEVL